MTGIKNLNDIFNEKGRQTLDLLLRSERVTIYEKLDGLNLCFTITSNGVDFFKKNRASVIGTVERTLTEMYEKPIQHIEGLNLDWSSLQGMTFGMVYFPSLQPNLLTYDSMPLNNLILSYVEDENGKKIFDKNLLDAYSETFAIGQAPILFDGKLDGTQIEKIFRFIENNNLDDKEPFAVYILKTLGIDSTILSENFYSQIEGLIFRFEDKDGNATSTKIINPYFENLSKEQKEKENVDHNYYLILSDIVDFLLNIDIQKIRLDKKELEDRYVELISILFNKFIKNRIEDYTEMSIQLPEYLMKNYNQLNLDRIKNKETYEYVISSLNLREIFRIFLASFRKRRTRENFIFNKNLNFDFNNIFESIKTKISTLENEENKDESIDEAFITYSEFERIYVNDEDSEDVLGLDLNSYLRKQPDLIKGFVETKFDINNFMSTMFVKTKRRKIRKDEREECILLIDSFDPITNLILDFSNHIYNKERRKIFLVSVAPRQEHYSKNIIENAFKNLIEQYEAFVDYAFLDRPNLKKIIEMYSDKYKFHKVIANSKYSKFIDMQIISNYRDNNYLNLADEEKDSYDFYQNDLSIVHASNRALEDSKFTEFKKHVPDCIANQFTDILRNFKFYNG